MNKESIKTHGHRSGSKPSKTYKTWEGMKYRCNNPKFIGHKNYYDKGITFCKRWLKFENFLKDMGIRPEGKTLDRIDGKRGYSKSNCRWATPTEQLRNTSANNLITYKEKTQCLASWVDELKINRGTLRRRLRNWKDIEKSFTAPIDKRYQRHVK